MWLLSVTLKSLTYWDFDYLNLPSDHMSDLYPYGSSSKTSGHMLLAIPEPEKKWFVFEIVNIQIGGPERMHKAKIQKGV